VTDKHVSEAERRGNIPPINLPSDVNALRRTVRTCPGAEYNGAALNITVILRWPEQLAFFNLLFDNYFTKELDIYQRSL
jgi:hypothetical protein